jgi:hypothetical protein
MQLYQIGHTDQSLQNMPYILLITTAQMQGTTTMHHSASMNSKVAKHTQCKTSRVAQLLRTAIMSRLRFDDLKLEPRRKLTHL